MMLSIARSWRDRHPKMGCRSLYYSIKSSGASMPMGVNAFERLMSREGLTVRRIKRSIPMTSDGKGRKTYTNLTNGLILNGINQLVVADITHIRIEDQWHYLFCLKDVYSQRLISLTPSKDMRAEKAVATLQDLVKIRGKSSLKGCIHHSDNGSQYDAFIFLDRLSSLEMEVSRAENCIENGSSEQMHHITKNMYIKPAYVNSFEQLQQVCKRVKSLINHERAVKQLGYKTVVQFEQWIASIPEEERPEKILYDFNQER